MASSHGTDRVSARRDLGNNPGLILIAPCPPPSGTSEHFEPADWLGDSTMFSVHSKPNGQNQTADSQIRISSGRWSRHTAYCECAHSREIIAVCNAELPDLFLIGFLGEGVEAGEVLQNLAGTEFGGQVLLVGPRNSLALSALRKLASPDDASCARDALWRKGTTRMFGEFYVHKSAAASSY